MYPYNVATYAPDEQSIRLRLKEFPDVRPIPILQHGGHAAPRNAAHPQQDYHCRCQEQQP